MLAENIQGSVDRWVSNDPQVTGESWWDRYEEEAALLGVALAVANLSRMSPAYAATRPIVQITLSDAYRARLAAARFSSLAYWAGLASSLRSDIAQIIGRAIATGTSPSQVRAEIAARVEVAKNRAMQYARTAITEMVREIRMAETDFANGYLGMRLGLLWASAFKPTTRPHHAARHGGVYTTQQVRDFYAQGSNRINCFLPSTKVRGRFVAGSKGHYEGSAVELVTAAGNRLSVTANHPVVTSRGLIAANEVREGDDLVSYRPQIENAARIGDLHDQHGQASIKQVFGALLDAGHLAPTGVLREDFHGDAALMQPQIEVVFADRVLAFGLDSAAGEFLDQLALVHADSTAPCRSFARQFFGASNLPAPGDVGHGGHGSTLLKRAGDMPQALSLTHAALPQPMLGEPPDQTNTRNAGSATDREDGLASDVCGVEVRHYRGAPFADVGQVAESESMERLHHGSVANPDALGDVLQRFAGLATLDQVIEVRRFEYSGHVYDLQELSGLMLGDGIAASNCYCSTTEVLLDEDGRPRLTPKLREAMRKEKRAWQETQPAA